MRGGAPAAHADGMSTALDEHRTRPYDRWPSDESGVSAGTSPARRPYLTEAPGGPAACREPYARLRVPSAPPSTLSLSTVKPITKIVLAIVIILAVAYGVLGFLTADDGVPDEADTESVEVEAVP